QPNTTLNNLNPVLRSGLSVWVEGCSVRRISGQRGEAQKSARPTQQPDPKLKLRKEGRDEAAYRAWGPGGGRGEVEGEVGGGRNLPAPGGPGRLAPAGCPGRRRRLAFAHAHLWSLADPRRL